jgi:hypothetical protein
VSAGKGHHNRLEWEGVTCLLAGWQRLHAMEGQVLPLPGEEEHLSHPATGTQQLAEARATP